MVEGHCLYTALTYLRKNFLKERVDRMEKYIQREKTGPNKARRRYVSVPSGKRARSQTNMRADAMPTFSEV